MGRASGWLGLLAWLGAAGCGAGPPPDRRPDLLVLMLDTTRAARLGVYGYGAPTTPRLDAFAAGARVYERALATSNWTLPSHASLFTGLHPRSHGATGSEGWLDDRFATLAERLADAGYETYLFSANPYVSEQHNLAQGFQVTAYAWQEPWRERVRAHMEARAGGAPLLRSRFVPFKDAGPVICDAFLAWQESRERGRPYFAFLNFMEAHRPHGATRQERARFLSDDLVARSYALDPSYVARHAYSFGLGGYDEADLRALGGLYDAALRELDASVGSLLEALAARGVLDRTLVVVVADHGEHTGDHGRLGHEYSLYDALLHVPLLLRYPPLFPPGRVADPVQIVDLYPTLLGVAGLEAQAGGSWQGLDLRAYPEGAGATRALVGESLDPKRRPLDAVARRHPGLDPRPWLSPLRSIEVGGYKLIASQDGRRELYAVAADPGETRDLAAAEPGRVRALLARLAAWDDETGPARASAARPASRARRDADERRRLESLGYLEEEPEPAPDSD